MGAVVGNKCYPDVPSAQDGYFQSIAPIFLPSGNTVSFQLIDGVWKRIEASASGVVSTNTAEVPTFPECDVMQGFNDGLALSVALTFAIVSASLYGIIARAK